MKARIPLVLSPQPEGGYTVTSPLLPDWGRRDLRIGTLRSAVRQLDLDWREFNNA